MSSSSLSFPSGSVRSRTQFSSGSISSEDSSNPETSPGYSQHAAIPGQSSSIELPRVMTHESQFDVINSKDSRTLEAKDVQYQVVERGSGFMQKLMKFENPCKGKNGGIQKKTILQEINFKTQSGQMLAILGSSGSGKTTLLDVIACQTFTGTVSGEVLLDGMPRTHEAIKSCSAYVRQDDRLLPHLTVKETLNFVAQLKLPPSWSKEKREQRVNSVIAELGLRHVAHGKVGGEEIRGISGGERRRVSIGIQLLLDPSVLFLDEPTSGLDSFTAHNLVETLAKLARNNRIVVMTIHQPRSDIFELFDVMMLLSQGHMVYFGPQREIVQYFTRIGYPCPELTNPCDYYVDLATVDHKTEETEEETLERVNRLIDLYRRRHNLTSADLDRSVPPPSYTKSELYARKTIDHDSVKYEADTGHSESKHADKEEDEQSDINVEIASDTACVEDVKDEVNEPEKSEPKENNSLEGQEQSSNDQMENEAPKKDDEVVEPNSECLVAESVILRKESEANILSFVNQAFESDATSDASSTQNWYMQAPTQPNVWSEQRKVFRDPSLVVGKQASRRQQSFERASSGEKNGYPVAVDMPPVRSYSEGSIHTRPLTIEQTEKSGVMLQYWVLIRRTLRNNLEDYGFLVVQAMEALFMSIIIGVIYLSLGLDQSGARDRFGMLYILAALYPYMVILDVIGKYYKERFILYYEMLDDLYSAGPYFFAKVAGDMPEHTVFIVFYCLPVYFLSGLQMDPVLFFQAFAILYILVLCSRSLALLSGSLFSAYPVSVIFAQSIYSMFLLSSGFIFNLDNLFVGMKWVSHISYLKWGYQALCITEFVGLNFTCTTPVPEACIQDGEDALESYSLDGGAVWQSSLVILGETILFLAMFFVTVKFKSQKPHQQ